MPVTGLAPFVSFQVGLGGWGDGGANRRVQKVLDRLDGGRPLASEQAYIEAVQREFPV